MPEVSVCVLPFGRMPFAALTFTFTVSPETVALDADSIFIHMIYSPYLTMIIKPGLPIVALLPLR